MSLSFHTSIFFIFNSPVFFLGVNSFFRQRRAHIRFVTPNKLTRSVIWLQKYAGFGNSIYSTVHKNTFSPRTVSDTAVPFPKQKEALFAKSVLLLWLGRSFQNSSFLFKLYSFREVFSSSVNCPTHKLQKHRADYGQRGRKSLNAKMKIRHRGNLSPGVPRSRSATFSTNETVFWLSRHDREPQ